jgi:hypothetical protein
VNIDHPEFRKLTEEGRFLATRIVTILQNYQAFDYESYFGVS